MDVTVLLAPWKPWFCGCVSCARQAPSAVQASSSVQLPPLQWSLPSPATATRQATGRHRSAYRTIFWSDFCILSYGEWKRILDCEAKLKLYELNTLPSHYSLTSSLKHKSATGKSVWVLYCLTIREYILHSTHTHTHTHTQISSSWQRVHFILPNNQGISFAQHTHTHTHTQISYSWQRVHFLLPNNQGISFAQHTYTHTHTHTHTQTLWHARALWHLRQIRRLAILLELWTTFIYNSFCTWVFYVYVHLVNIQNEIRIFHEETCQGE
jgi:hypothetical protein